MKIDAPSTNKPIHFLGINALRFIAAFSIIVYHCTLDIQAGNDTILKKGLHNLVIGVDLFFIISGFLITYLLIIEKKKNGAISFQKFYMRRILRIFPLYYLIVLFGYIVYSTSHPETDFFSHLFFLGNFSMISSGNWTVSPLIPLWSICIEEHFYLVIPLLVHLLPLKRLHVLFYGIIGLSLAFRLYTYYTVQYPWMIMYLHTLSRCDIIALGGLLAWYYDKYRDTLKISVSNLICAIPLLLVLMFTIDYVDFDSLWNVSFKKYVYILPLVFLFLYFLFPKKEYPVISFFRQNKTLDYLGKISYGLYMYHSIVILLLLRFPMIAESVFLKIASVTLLTILVSTLSYEFFEKQILKLKKKYEVVQSKSSQ